MKYLEQLDSQMLKIIEAESLRQEDGLELIASENYASRAVMEVQGSILTNKYAEGYPGKRYYGGCSEIDKAEQLAIERAKQLFNCEYANVQPHSGSSANMAVYFACLNYGDTVLGMSLDDGGHLTHGSPVNFSGKLFDFQSYRINHESELLDYDIVLAKAKECKPRLIVAGASAYSRTIDFEKFRQIADEVGALLLVDMAHIAGLVAAGLHPSPLPYADFVTSTTHKTLRGPRGGIILSNRKEWFKKLNSQIFPGIQGGPLEHVIAAKAVAFQEALQEEFKAYQQQVIDNAKVLSDKLSSQGAKIVSGGTDNHLLMVKTESYNISGKDAEHFLEQAGITCNKNMIPNDPRSPFITSGIRLGTPAITTRGFKQKQLEMIANWIHEVLSSPEEIIISQVRQQVQDLCKNFPVYKD